jgi:putative transcriptional regulator
MAEPSEARLTNRLRALRFEHGELTQQDLANRVGVSRQTINAIESRKYAPSLPLAFRLAAVFRLRIEDVFLYVSEAGSEPHSQQDC